MADHSFDSNIKMGKSKLHPTPLKELDVILTFPFLCWNQKSGRPRCECTYSNFSEKSGFYFIRGQSHKNDRRLKTGSRLWSLIADTFLQLETWEVHFCSSLVPGYQMDTLKLLKL